MKRPWCGRGMHVRELSFSVPSTFWIGRHGLWKGRCQEGHAWPAGCFPAKGAWPMFEWVHGGASCAA